MYSFLSKLLTQASNNEYHVVGSVYLHIGSYQEFGCVARTCQQLAGTCTSRSTEGESVCLSPLQKENTVESRFFQPSREMKIGLKNQLVRESGGEGIRWEKPQ